MNIDLRSLKHAVVLAKVLSYTKAAQELCITQSALSRSIQAIERYAHAKLFDRDRSGVHLTTVGREFVKRAAIILRDAEDLDRTLKRSANADKGEVAFGMGPLAAQALLPSVLPETFSTKPELRTNVMVRHVDALLPALLKEEIELVVTAESESMNSTQLQSEFLGWFPLSLIVRAGHPLLRGVQMQRKGSYPLLSPGQFSNFQDWPAHIQRYLNGPLHVIEDYGVAARITELTDAIWLSSTFAAIFEIRSRRLQEIPSPKGQKSFRLRMMVYSLSKRSLSPAAVLLKQAFQKQLQALAKESTA